MPSSVYHQTFRTMGTRFSLVLPGTDPLRGDELTETARRFLSRQERLLSRFDNEGSLSDLNARAATEDATPPPGLWQALLACRRHWHRTNGAFDITLRPLTNLWNDASAQGREPTQEEIDSARETTGFGRVRFDETKQSVRFEKTGMSLDLGGFGKGWALDLLREELSRQGVSCALLSLGDSSITALGRHPAGPPWSVGVPDPLRPERILHRFSLEGTSLSISGNRDLEFARAHILDPFSGRPLLALKTVSVCASTAAEAEALSTALFVLPRERWQTVLANYPGARAETAEQGPVRPGSEGSAGGNDFALHS